MKAKLKNTDRQTNINKYRMSTAHVIIKNIISKYKQKPYVVYTIYL